MHVYICDIQPSALCGNSVTAVTFYTMHLEAEVKGGDELSVNKKVTPEVESSQCFIARFTFVNTLVMFSNGGADQSQQFRNGAMAVE